MAIERSLRERYGLVRRPRGSPASSPMQAGQAALAAAVWAGDPARVQQLLADGADTEDPDASGHTPLIVANYAAQATCAKVEPSSTSQRYCPQQQ